MEIEWNWLFTWSEFSIHAAVKSSDGSNTPFVVQSDVTFDGLRIAVSEKLRCFPGLLKLRYRLESDKPKASATSIQLNDELKFFINRMRGLIVPQRLPSGKISSRVLKPVLVYFEDAGEEKEVMVTNKSTTSSKKVCILKDLYLAHYLIYRLGIVTFISGFINQWIRFTKCCIQPTSPGAPESVGRASNSMALWYAFKRKGCLLLEFEAQQHMLRFES
jgi:hypothetical protein